MAYTLLKNNSIFSIIKSEEYVQNKLTENVDVLELSGFTTSMF